MEKEYVRELDHAYLVLKTDQIDEDEYVLQMAMRGRLAGILPLSIARRDGKKSLRADVTACTSITSRFKNVALTAGDVRKILSAIRDTAMKMPALLMSVRDLFLDPDFIFLSAGGDEILICYIPHISDTEPDSVRLLSEFLLKRLDHSDQAAAQLAYAFYDQVSQDSCVLTDVIQKLLLSGGMEDQDPAVKPISESSHPDREGSSVEERCPLPRRDQQIYSFEEGSGERGAKWEEFPSFNVKKLPPPGKRNTSWNRKMAGARGHSGRNTGKKDRRDRHTSRLLIPALIILPAAAAAIFIFRMDITQILGMGFLCAALIWMIHSSLEKYAGEGKNRWFDDDEDPDSDDQFYQSLRRDLYAENPGFFEGESGYDRYTKPDGYTKPDEPDERTRLLGGKKPVLVSLQKDLCPDITISRDYLILGTSRQQADILLPGDTVSRKHARIERRTDGYYVTDLFSTNGTFLDTHRLESGQAVALRDGAQLTLASLHYKVMIPSA